MEYRWTEDPENPNSFLYTDHPRRMQEMSDRALSQISDRRPLVDPVTHPVLTKVGLWSFGVVVAAILTLGFIS